jgi:hypothetical protein
MAGSFLIAATDYQPFSRKKLASPVATQGSAITPHSPEAVAATYEIPNGSEHALEANAV